MAASTTLYLFSVATLFLSLITFSLSVSEYTVDKAANILSTSGYISMSLTLQLVSQTLISNASAATIFSPSDEAFSRCGGPSTSRLQYQCSPVSYSVDELRSLPFGSKIPTLLPGHSLFITTLPSDNHISINHVKIADPAIYDDGTLVVLAADDFFSPNFHTPSPALTPKPNPKVECEVNSNGRLFADAVESLRSKGFSIIASFLDVQLVQFDDDDTQFTVFAPIDKALQKRIGDYNGWGSLFLQHVVPCDVSHSVLNDLEDGAVLSTILEEFWITVTRSGDLPLLNGVPVVFPDVYHGDRLTVHGIQDVLHLKSKYKGMKSPSHKSQKDVINEF